MAVLRAAEMASARPVELSNAFGDLIPLLLQGARLPRPGLGDRRRQDSWLRITARWHRTTIAWVASTA